MKWAQVTVFALLAVLAAAREFPAEDGYMKINKGIYLPKLLEEKLSWQEASKNCKEQGLELLTIESQEEHDAVMSVLGQFITDRIWIAGSDLGSEGNFYWTTTGAAFNLTGLWHAGEPSGNNPTNGIKEDCVQYWNRNGTLLWNDSPCENEYSFICEYNDPCARNPFL